MTNPDAQDSDDMARLAAGHDASLNDLMERHGQRLFHYLLRSLKEDAAADIAQETFVRVYHNRGKYDPSHKFSTWLYTIATNQLRDHFRRRQRRPEISLDAIEEESGGGFAEKFHEEVSTPSEDIMARERVEQVHRAVQSLPEELRTPLILFEYEDQSQAEIAAILDCSPKAIEMRLYHARQQLKTKLRDLA